MCGAGETEVNDATVPAGARPGAAAARGRQHWPPAREPAGARPGGVARGGRLLRGVSRGRRGVFSMSVVWKPWAFRWTPSPGGRGRDPASAEEGGGRLPVSPLRSDVSRLAAGDDGVARLTADDLRWDLDDRDAPWWH